MVKIPLSRVGISDQHACDVCGVRSAKTIAPTSLGFVLLCETCEHPDTNHLPGAAGASVKSLGARKAIEMNREQLFPSKYFKASNLMSPLTVTIASADVEKVNNPNGGVDEKLVLGFEGHKKRLVCNVTNYDAIAEAYGDDTEGWPGNAIELYPTKTTLGNKRVDAIRVRIPSDGVV
jgi:hypothetical protein